MNDISSPRSTRQGLSQWFLLGDGIAREVIAADIQRYLGPDALVRPGEHEGRAGYWITAYRMLTSDMIEDLKLDSERWQQYPERWRQEEQTAREGRQVLYQDSQIHASRQYWGPLPPYGHTAQETGGYGYAQPRSNRSQEPVYPYYTDRSRYGAQSGYFMHTASQRPQAEPNYYITSDRTQYPLSQTVQQPQQQQPLLDPYTDRHGTRVAPGYYIASDGNQYPISQMPKGPWESYLKDDRGQSERKKIESLDKVDTVNNGPDHNDRPDHIDDTFTAETTTALSENRSSRRSSIGGTSSYHSQSVQDISTLPTSQGEKKIEITFESSNHIPDFDDQATTFSVGAGPNELELEYVQAFAETLARDVEEASGITDLSKIPIQYMNEVLRAFTWRMHEESSNPFQWGTCLTLNRARENIYSAFTKQESGTMATCDEDCSSVSETDDSTTLDRTPFVKSLDMMHEWMAGTIANDNEQSTDEQHLPEIDNYESFIKDSEAYQWLVGKICQHECLTFVGHDVMNDIGRKLRADLNTQSMLRQMSRRKPLLTVEVTITVQWHPLIYVQDQLPLVATDLPDNLLDKILCITGSWREAQATTVSEYLKQTWPATYVPILDLFNQMLQYPEKSEHTVHTLKGPKLSAHSDSSSSYLISAIAGTYCVSEIAEQIAWLVATLQPASKNRSIVSHFPEMKCNSVDRTDAEQATAPKVVAMYTLSLKQDESINPNDLNGRCWNALFRNPTFASGYPIPRRSQSGLGLEISLGPLAQILRTNEVTQCSGTIKMKGLSALLCATSVSESLVIWHLFARNGMNERISYFPPGEDALQKVANDAVSLRMLRKARHVVGWCPDVEDLCGDKSATFTIRPSQLPSAPSSIVIDRMYIEAGMHIIGGLNMRINQKCDPIFLSHGHDYPSLLRWISLQPVVFFDVSSSDQRAWLVDGASALLHLARISLARDASDDYSTFEWVFDGSKLIDDWPQCNGRQSAINTLRHSDNLNLNVYIKNQVGTDVQYSTFRERVLRILHALELLIDTQQKEAAKGELSMLQTIDRRKFVSGYDALNVVDPVSAVNARVYRFEASVQGWMDLLPCIGALTLFGKDFGDLIRPKNPSVMCSYWKSIPTRMNYMCVSMTTLKMVYETRVQDSGNQLGVGHLAEKIQWVSPSKVFDVCSCMTIPREGELQHTGPVQYLITKNKAWRMLRPKEMDPVDLRVVDGNGAVIFANLGRFHKKIINKMDVSAAKNEEEQQAEDEDGLSQQQSTNTSISKDQSFTSHTTDTAHTSIAPQSSMSASGQGARTSDKSGGRGWKDKILTIFRPT